MAHRRAPKILRDHSPRMQQSPESRILSLQRTIGNRAVRNMARAGTFPAGIGPVAAIRDTPGRSEATPGTREPPTVTRETTPRPSLPACSVGSDEGRVRSREERIRSILPSRGRGLNNEEEDGKTRVSLHHAPAAIQRELATPPPKVAPAAQPDLTDAQIESALRFNRARYAERDTRHIQGIVGTKPTGVWSADDIRAIASIQEKYGLTKDGKVGFNTFRFLDEEVRREGLPTTDENCLVSFNINRDRENIVPSPAGARMTRHFTMQAQFPSHCTCANYEYRQFIRGHFTVERAGVVRDFGDWFANLPAGRLNPGWQEDGHTGVPSVNFGHRDRSSEADNRYLNDRGAIDMRNGCRYEGDDTPGGNFTGWNGFGPATGDIFDIDVNFRGEIQRRGRKVREHSWSALQRRFRLP